MTPVLDELAEALDICDREPIHVPGSIQPHGFLLAFDAKGFVSQASANASAALCLPAGRVCGSDLVHAFGSPIARVLPGFELSGFDSEPRFLGATLAPDGFTYQAVAHCHRGAVILEFERTPEVAITPSSTIFALVRDFMTHMASASSMAHMLHTAACEVRRLTGFDRVLIYRFDEQWNGTVVAEDRNAVLPLYLDLRFPASDIPAQARELYRLNRLRIIPDAGYSAVPIEPALNPQTGRPLDLTHSVLRSVSPVHVQYMKNMGTGSSMSISILRDGELWGLVSCHSKLARQIPFEVRSACDMIAQVLSAQLAAAEHRAAADSRVALKSTQTRLLGHMSEDKNLAEALANHPADLLACTRAEGAAIIFEGQCHSFGVAPPETFIREFTAWLGLRAGRETVFATDSLGSVFAPAKPLAATAGGAIAVSISALHDSYLLWFRPEVEQTVKWGGDPRKALAPAEAGSGSPERIDPRHSFDVWKEQVRGYCLPWSRAEIDSAADLRHAIIRVVLRKAEELAQLSGELLRSNQELEAFSYSVSHDLRAPFRHIDAFSELLRESDSANLSDTGRRYLSTISESAVFAGILVDNLLSFSQMGRTTYHFMQVDSLRLVEEAKSAALTDEPGRSVEWRIGPLPRVRGDLAMLRRVFQNLISNALKFTRLREPAIIEISAERRTGETVFTVSDNGVGFDPLYSDKLFGVFQRLHKLEEFEGIGIGLANVRRIVMRHGGLAWAVGVLDQGAAFSFSIPDAVNKTTMDKDENE